MRRAQWPAIVARVPRAPVYVVETVSKARVLPRVERVHPCSTWDHAVAVADGCDGRTIIVRTRPEPRTWVRMEIMRT